MIGDKGSDNENVCDDRNQWTRAKHEPSIWAKQLNSQVKAAAEKARKETRKTARMGNRTDVSKQMDDQDQYRCKQVTVRKVK